MFFYGSLVNHQLVIENQEIAKRKGLPLIECELGENGTIWEKGFKPEKTDKEKAAEEIAELKQKLEDSDYAIVKIAEGAATQADYAELIEQRAQWRARINELEATIE